MVQLQHETLAAFYHSLAVKLEAPQEEAATFSRNIVRADLRGKLTQGAAIVPYLVSLVERRLARFDAPWRVLTDSGAAAVIDGGRGVGAVVASRAMELAMDRAKRYGAASVWVRNGGDYAMASNHVLQAVEQGLVGITMRNGNPRVAAWGGAEAAFGTDPVAVGIPARSQPPVVIDMAAGSYSVGHVIMAARDGRPVDAALLVGADGRYTTDPAAVVADPSDRESSFLGSIVSQGYRGFAWLLIAELMTGLLAGTGPSLDNSGEPDADEPWNEAMYFQAIDPAVLSPEVDFRRQVDRMCSSLASMEPAEGFDQIRIPGWAAHHTEETRRREGIPLRNEVYEDLLAVGRAYGVELREVPSKGEKDEASE